MLFPDLGATLLGFALRNWMAREATRKAIKASFIGNLAVQVLAIAVNGYEIAAGTLLRKTAPGMVIPVMLGLVFVRALRTAGCRAAA